MYPDNHPEAGPSRPRTPPTPSSADSTTLTPQFEATNIFDNPNNSNDGIAIAGPGGELETGPEMGGNQVMIDSKGDELYYRTYRGEKEDLWGVKRLIDQELSEPYTVYTFRYFLNEWPQLTFLVFPSPQSTEPIATIMCKQESHRGKTNRGYIGMLSVDKAWRRRGIASKLVKLAISQMAAAGAHEIVLETEYDNEGSLALYDSIGFLREKRVHGFYSNLKDAFRLNLRLPSPTYQTPAQDLTERKTSYSGDGPGRADGTLTDDERSGLRPRDDPFPPGLDMYT